LLDRGCLVMFDQCDGASMRLIIIEVHYMITSSWTVCQCLFWQVYSL